MKARACTKTFEGRRVLSVPEISFAPGKIYALIGANGSGKSTFARLLAGVLPADGRGRVLEGPGRVGYMPQRSYAFRLTTQANILLAGKDRDRAARLMVALGLTDLARQRAGGLSGGETAKMALARLLMGSFDLLLLDEPTAAMDMESAILAEGLVDAHRRETGCTVLLITHDLQQARRMADEALFFREGQLWEQGPAETLLYTPERPETRQFLAFYGGA